MTAQVLDRASVQTLLTGVSWTLMGIPPSRQRATELRDLFMDLPSEVREQLNAVGYMSDVERPTRAYSFGWPVTRHDLLKASREWRKMVPILRSWAEADNAIHLARRVG